MQTLAPQAPPGGQAQGEGEGEGQGQGQTGANGIPVRVGMGQDSHFPRILQPPVDLLFIAFLQHFNPSNEDAKLKNIEVRITMAAFIC